MALRHAEVRMGIRIVWASLRYGRRRVAVACAAVALGVSLPATLVGLRGVQGRVEQELAAYGANILLVPRIGTELRAESLAQLDQMITDGRLEAYVPILSFVARIRGRDAAVVGIRFPRARALYRWWTVEGAWPDDVSGALVGANMAAKLGLHPGDVALVETRGAVLPVRVTGLVRTGGSEENQLFVDLDIAQRLVGRPGVLSLVQARSRRSRELAAVAETLAAAVPDAEVRTPLQVAQAEGRVLGRLQRLLALMTGTVLVASGLGVFATMAAAVLERQREVGVMKALGAEAAVVVRLFAAEAVGIGLAGGIAGCGLGLLLADAIAWRVFGTMVAPSAFALGVSLAVGLGVSLGASLGPVRRAARVVPVRVLRGA